jgi:hypothetical protein
MNDISLPNDPLWLTDLLEVLPFLSNVNWTAVGWLSVLTVGCVWAYRLSNDD